jgi:hypothetical protein
VGFVDLNHKKLTITYSIELKNQYTIVLIKKWGKDFCRLLIDQGESLARIKGSHHISLGMGSA